MQLSFFRARDDARASVPARAAGLFLLVFGALWLLVHGGSVLVPPMDNLEQLIWVRKLDWGYYKHPPLTTVLLWPLVQLFGLHGWVTYVLGGGLTLASLGWLWWLLRRMQDSRFATLALLAMLCITFVAGRLHFYNHNITLLLFTVASAVFAWLAFEQQRWRWWLLLGCSLGLGALAKYQIGLSVVALLVLWLLARGWQSPVHRGGLVLAGLVSMAVFAPHAWWQLQQGGGALGYALSTSVEAGEAGVSGALGSLQWLADQLLGRAMLSGLLLGLGVWFWRRRLRRQPPEAAIPNANLRQEDGGKQRAPLSARIFLLVWGGVPLLLMTLMGMLMGSELQRHWGVAYLPILLPGLMLLAPRVDWAGVLSRPVWRTFLVLQLLLVAQVVLTSAHGLPKWRNKSWRNFDAARVAAAMTPQVQQALGGPVRVIIGDSKEAGAVALALRERPLVLLNNNYRWSPWVPEDLVARCGAVVLRADYLVAPTKEPATEAAREAARVWAQGARPLVIPQDAVTGHVENLGGGITAMHWVVLPPESGQPACSAL